MTIGILTFYRVANFGANLQALSTYKYLLNHGHQPVMLNYYDRQWYAQFEKDIALCEQYQKHISFISEYLPSQSEICYSADDINREITRLGIEAIIVGSDAVMQHHPLITRINRGKRKPFYISPIGCDRLFPNPLWGVGVAPDVKMALMSGSSQNSKYRMFTHSTRQAMRDALGRFTYLGVRDNWTLKMFMEGIGIKNVNLTPDPVFAFNYNVEDLIPTTEDIRTLFSLPEKYVLVSLHGQDITYEQLVELKTEFAKKGYTCIALPMPTGIRFKHPFDIEIPTPLSPIHWYALIKYADGYVGSNMHPIVVSLHNAVPCFSIDNWGTRNWLGKATDDGSSKVGDIMNICGVGENRVSIGIKGCKIDSKTIVDSIEKFPKHKVENSASTLYDNYQNMMSNILKSFEY